MIFEQGMHCPKCAEVDRNSVITETGDLGLLQCPDHRCLALFINMPEEKGKIENEVQHTLH